jgi:hypothetical protein
MAAAKPSWVMPVAMNGPCMSPSVQSVALMMIGGLMTASLRVRSDYWVILHLLALPLKML